MENPKIEVAGKSVAGLSANDDRLMDVKCTAIHRCNSIIDLDSRSMLDTAMITPRTGRSFTRPTCF